MNNKKLLGDNSLTRAFRESNLNEGLKIKILEVKKMIFSVEKRNILWSF
ncbi:hypothetical protein [Tissierella sp.]